MNKVVHLEKFVHLNKQPFCTINIGCIGQRFIYNCSNVQTSRTVDWVKMLTALNVLEVSGLELIQML